MSKEEFIYFAKMGNDYVNKLPSNARIRRGMVIRLNGKDIPIPEHRGKFLKQIVDTDKKDLLRLVLLSMAELGVMVVHSELSTGSVDKDEMFNTGAFVKELLKYTETE